VSGDRLADEDTSQQAGLGPLNYDALPGLEDVVLEDSFMREIVEAPGTLRLVVMAALRKGHPFYEPPSPNERHCYRTAMLTSSNAEVRWTTRATRRFTDAQGAVDLGNIDHLVALPKGGYHLEGDFGVLEIIRSKAPVLTMVGASPGLRSYRRDALDAWVRGATTHIDHPPLHSPREVRGS
jgi:hypothetical protein